MAAELDKLARELKDRGYITGSHLVSLFSKTLIEGNLIPEELNANTQPPKFSKTAKKHAGYHGSLENENTELDDFFC